MYFTQNISACPTQSHPHVLTFHQAPEEFEWPLLHRALVTEERGSCSDCSIAALSSPGGATGHSYMPLPPHAQAPSTSDPHASIPTHNATPSQNASNSQERIPPAMHFTHNISACPTQNYPHVLTFHQAPDEFEWALLHQALLTEERGLCSGCSIAALPSPAGTTGHSYMSPRPHAHAPSTSHAQASIPTHNATPSQNPSNSQERMPSLIPCRALNSRSIKEVNHYYSCSWVHCKQTFVSEEAAHRHASPTLITQVVKKGFCCPHDSCNKVYTSRRGAEAHVKKKHFGLRENFECSLCDTTLESKSAAKRHEETDTKRHACAWCGQSYSRTSYALGRHKKYCKGRERVNEIDAAPV